MKGSKTVLLRIVEIDRRVRAGEYPKLAQLAVDLEVSDGTIRRDLRFLRDMGAPLEYCRSRRGYYYSEESFTLPAYTLTEGELLALFIAQQALEPLKGTRLAEQLGDALERLTRYLPEEVTLDLNHLRRIVSYDHSSTQLYDAQTFQKLVDASLRKKQLEVVYFSHSSDEVTSGRIIDPYHLACLDGRWYLFAHCHLRQGVRMFVPSRIRQIKETGNRFQVPADFSPQAYLDGSLGVIREQEDHHVHLRFSPAAAPYVAEKEWHPSQQLVEQGDGSLDVHLDLNGLEEVTYWVLSYGRKVRVLAPEALQQRVRDELQAAWERYESAGTLADPGR